jgi:hypothetical protein
VADRGPTLLRVAAERASIRAEWAIGQTGCGGSERDLSTKPELFLCLIELVHLPLAGTLSEAGGVSIIEK